MRCSTVAFLMVLFSLKMGFPGFNLDAIESEKLPHFAKTLKTGALKTTTSRLLCENGLYVLCLLSLLSLLYDLFTSFFVGTFFLSH